MHKSLRHTQKNRLFAEQSESKSSGCGSQLLPIPLIIPSKGTKTFGSTFRLRFNFRCPLPLCPFISPLACIRRGLDNTFDIDTRPLTSPTLIEGKRVKREDLTLLQLPFHCCFYGDRITDTCWMRNVHRHTHTLTQWLLSDVRAPCLLQIYPIGHKAKK